MRRRDLLKAGLIPASFVGYPIIKLKKRGGNVSQIGEPVDEVVQAYLNSETSRCSRRMSRPEREGEKEDPACGYEWKQYVYMVVFTWKADDSSGRSFCTSRLFASEPCPHMALFYVEDRFEPRKIRVMAADGSSVWFRLEICMKRLVKEVDGGLVVQSEFVPRYYGGGCVTMATWIDEEGEPLREPIQIGD